MPTTHCGVKQVRSGLLHVCISRLSHHVIISVPLGVRIAVGGKAYSKLWVSVDVLSENTSSETS